MSLVDAVNEHRPLRGAMLEALFSRLPAGHPARAVCDCPDGEPGALASGARVVEAGVPEGGAGATVP